MLPSFEKSSILCLNASNVLFKGSSNLLFCYCNFSCFSFHDLFDFRSWEVAPFSLQELLLYGEDSQDTRRSK